MSEYPKYIKYNKRENEKQAVEELYKYFRTREYIRIIRDKENKNERNKKDV